MKKITIELSTKGINQAIREFNEYKKEYTSRTKSLRGKMDEVCRRLAELGAIEARKLFYKAASAETGNGNVSVSVEKTPNGYKIVAKGEDVYFIEFGTGDAAGMYYGDGLPETDIPIYPGSYSERNAARYSTYGYWFYNGEIMSSTDSYMPMFYAGKKIRKNARRVMKEVFSE